MGKLIVQIIQQMLQIHTQLENLLNILSSWKICVYTEYYFKLIFQLAHV